MLLCTIMLTYYLPFCSCCYAAYTLWEMFITFILKSANVVYFQIEKHMIILKKQPILEYIKAPTYML